MLAPRNTARARQQELSAAYAALAVELTKHEIRSIGGYSLGRVIGEGTFGKVRLGVHRLTGTRVAIKQVPKSLPSYSPSDPSSPLSLLTREIHHHRRLRHPHVLSLYELVATESSIYLVTELCSGGELFDYLVEQCATPAGTGGLALAETRRIFGQLVLGVAYLHSEGVVHRDLKLENVLLDENVNVKIADMGFGREFERGRWLETKVGTLGYTAPEIVAGSRYLGEQVDIWSLGVILYALLTGSLPFDDDDESVMRSLILAGRYAVPAFLDPDASDLVQRILVVDPLRRPSLRDILAHPFFTRVPGPSSPPTTTARGPAPPIASPAASLGAPTTPLASSSSAASGAPMQSYFAPASASPASSSASPDAPASAVSLGKRRAVDLDLNLGPGPVSPAHSPSPSPSPAHPSSSSAITLPASAIPPHLFPSSSSHALSAHSTSGSSPHPHPWSPSPLRRHPSTASIDFGPSAPPVVRTHSTGGASVSSLQLGGAGANGSAGAGAGSGGPGDGPGGAVAARKRRKSVGAASVRSVRSAMLGGAVSEEDEQEDGVEPPTTAAPASAPAAALDDNSPRVDYLSLLLALTSPGSTSPSSTKDSPLTSPSDVALLAQLADIGFDTGQVAHSVRTSACDSCAAAWWMLKRKKEELALRQSEEAREQEGEGEGEVRAPSRTSSLRSLPTEEKRRSALLSQTEEDEEHEGDERSGADSDDDVFLTTAAVAAAPKLVASPLVLPETIPEEQRRPSVTSAASSVPSNTLAVPLTPPRRPSTASHASPRTPSSPAPLSLPHLSPALAYPSPAVAAARLSYFLQADPATPLPPVESEPLLSYFPVADGAPGSPSRPRIGAGAAASLGSSVGRSRSRSGEPLGRSTGGGGPGSPERSDGAALELDAGSSSSTPRRRAGSIGMHLARATSAIGQGLASLSSSTSGGNLALAAAGGSDEGNTAAQVPRKASPPAVTTATAAADEPVSHDALAPVPAPAHATSLLRTPPLVAVPLASPSPSLSAPSTPHARHVAAPLLDPVSVSAGHTPDPGVPPALGPSPRRTSDGKEAETLSGAVIRPITTIATSPSMLARSQSESVRSHSGTFHTASTSGPSASPNGMGRASSLRLVPGSSGAGPAGVGGGKKSLKGANLLSTFKLWFGQSADGPRKRKRASLVAPPSASLSSSASKGGSISFSASSSSSAGHGTSAAVARSQSMYVASPLRQSRPGMGSRRSSANSVSSPIGSLGAHGPGGAGMSLSRRSSVSSARGETLTRTPSSRRAGGGGGAAGGYGSGRPRRASDASRTSASERGAWGSSSGAQGGEGAGAGASRPASVRSLSAGQLAHRGPRHAHGHAHSHSRAPSSSSVASLLLESGAAVVGPAAVYRRPPTTTTVRRRHGGSHGRLSGESARSSSANVLATPGGGGQHRDHHRRTRSSASSAHRASSESDVGGGGGTGGDSEYEDEDFDGTAGGLYVDFDEGEAPILEEDETAQDDSATGSAAPPGPSTASTSASSSLSPPPPPARSSSRPPPVARTRSSDRANSLGLGLALSHSPSASPSLSPGSAAGPSFHHHHHHHHHHSHHHTSHASSSSPASSLSRFSTGTGTSATGTTFTAHKATHLFGSPLQPRPAPSRPPGTGAAAATRPVRDVFSKHAAAGGSGLSGGGAADDAAASGSGGAAAAAAASSEWVDEDDDLAGYGGGLGQPAAGSAAALGGHEQPRAGSGGGGGGGGGAGMGDSPVAMRMWEATSAGAGAGAAGGAGGGASRFEGRYAGLSLVGGAGAAGASQPVGSSIGGGAGVGQQQGRWARPAMVVEEEEEEEE